MIRNVLAALAIAAAAIAPAHALSVLPLQLDEVIDTSTTVLEGTCVENRSERDPATDLVVTYTTFEVKDVMKGHAAARHTIKQLGGSLPGEGLRYRVEGVPTFTVGEDYVVFLAGTSSAGFSSPIGLNQGRFRITQEGAVRRAGNGRDLREMTSRMAAHLPAAAQARMQNASGAVKSMDVEDLKQAVRNHVGAGR